MSTAIVQSLFPDEKYIINHDIMHCTADGVVGNYLYSGRALGISEPWDIIQLHRELEPLLDDITRHYRNIGLSYSENIIWDTNRRHLGGYIGFQPSVFYFGPNECKYWGDHYWLDSVEFINSKNNFIALAEELGIDIPITLCFDSVKEIKPEYIPENIYPCYLKAAISVSGVGIYRCRDESELIEALGKFYDVPVQIQEEIKTDTFLNLQYQVTGKDIIHLTASEQILDGFAHQGNRVPASYNPWHSVDVMAEWLKEHGMKGIFAFDVAVVKTDFGMRFPVIECNPRFNGASYPTLIAHKLNITEWTAMTFDTRFKSLADIDLSEIEYNHKTGEGAIIVNWGTVLLGKLVIMLAGSRAYQEALEIELKSRL